MNTFKIGYLIRLIVSITLFYVILWLPPMEIDKNLKYYADAPSVLSETAAQKLAIEEHKKATDEIAFRIKQRYDWYKWKFIIIGSLFLGAFTFFGLNVKHFDPHFDKAIKSNKLAEDFLKSFLSSNYTISIISLALIVLLTLDMYERNNFIVVNQLGLWITYYVEPAFYSTRFPVTESYRGFLGWEQFIRTGGGGLQTDVWNSITNWGSLHIFTVALYGIFNISFYQMVCCDKPKFYWFTLSGYLFVYFSIFYFAISGHILPQNFQFIIFNKLGIGTLITILIYSFLSLLIFIINLPEFLKYIVSSKDEVK